MRVLAFDPGAKRAGWAVLDEGPIYVASACVYFERGKNPEEAFQVYRMRLCEFWEEYAESLIAWYRPTRVVTETVPPVGANNMSQMYLANVMATTVHTVCHNMMVPVSQVSARTVSTRIAIRKPNTKVTKVQVRAGVLQLLPELKPRLADWIKIFEEPDAISIGLHALNHTLV